MPATVKNEEEVRYYEYFQYGQHFVYGATKFRMDRDSIFNFIVRTIPEEALLKGFDHVAEKTQELLENNNEIRALMKPHMVTMLDSVAYDMGFAHGLITQHKTTTETMVEMAGKEVKTTVQDIKFLAHPPELYDHGYDKEGNFEHAVVKTQYKKLIITPSEGENQAPVTSYEYPFIYHTVTPDTAIHVMSIPDPEKHGEGLAYINPIFDDLWSLYCLAESITFYIIREAGGKRIGYIPQEDLEDPEKRAKYIETLTKYNAPNSIDLIGIDTDKEKEPPRIEVVSGQTGSGFGEERKIYYERIAMKTGIPMSKFESKYHGELAAGEITQAEVFAMYEQFQEKYTSLYLELLRRVTEFYGTEFIASENTTIEFSEVGILGKTRKSLTDAEKTELTSGQLDNLLKLVPVYEELGMELTTVQSITDLKWDIDEAIMAEAKLQKQQMMETFNKEDDEEDTDDDTDQDPPEST